MSSKTRNLLIAAVVGVAVVFLIGYIPQYRRATALETDVAQARERVASLERDVRLSKARDLASLTYLEVTKNNFGTAAQHATRLFDEIREISEQTADSHLRTELQSMLRERDAVVAGMAKADPAIQPTIRQILERLFEITRAG